VEPLSVAEHATTCPIITTEMTDIGRRHPPPPAREYTSTAILQDSGPLTNMGDSDESSTWAHDASPIRRGVTGSQTLRGAGGRES
jgi:hypothetical protein